MSRPVPPEMVLVTFAVLAVALVSGLLIGARIPSSGSPSMCEPNGGITPITNVNGSPYCFENVVLHEVPYCDNGIPVNGSPIGAVFWSVGFDLTPLAYCPTGIFCSLCGPGIAVLVMEPNGTSFHGLVPPAHGLTWLSPDLQCGVSWQADTVNVTLYVAVGA